ncbi:MAG: hypothetical protein ABIR17_00015 [Pseudolysinimonas sp.]|uniref:hypothetical protein n=1 Tax=Pseudolysinimonas sp. TaxID=2680009 RepID=UPI003264C42F
MKNRRVSRNAPIAAAGAVLLGLSLALVPAVSASAATGQLSVSNNCSYAVEYHVSDAGWGYTFPGDTESWTLESGWYTVSSSEGVRNVWVAPDRGVSVSFCH